MSIKENLNFFNKKLEGKNARLVAVSKTYPADIVKEAYDCGQRLFGENKVQELVEKAKELPGDIEWHLIGHLQSNKVKYIAPFISVIQSVDSLKLLKEIDKEAKKYFRTIPCYLQLHIAKEESKFGLSFEECQALIFSEELKNLKNVIITGFMGMATNTDNEETVRSEFHSLKSFFEKIKSKPGLPVNVLLKEISMGMSGDYKIALEEGSSIIRVGSAIFGQRNYPQL